MILWCRILSKDHKIAVQHILLLVFALYAFGSVFILLFVIKEDSRNKSHFVKVNISSYRTTRENIESQNLSRDIQNIENLVSGEKKDFHEQERNRLIQDNTMQGLSFGKELNYSVLSEKQTTLHNEDQSILSSLASIEGLNTGDTSGGKGAEAGVGPHGYQRGNSYTSRINAVSRQKAVKSNGGSDKTEESVLKALRYLLQCQGNDGSWGGTESRNTGDVVALSSLSLLAFLGHGEHYKSEDFGPTVVKGVDYLLYAAQIPSVEYVGHGFGHAILTYALAEAYAVTGDLKIKPVLEARVRAIIQHQNSLGSFSVDYSHDLIDEAPSAESLEHMTDEQKLAAVQVIAGEPTCDLSLLGWHIQALTAAKVAGIQVDGLDECVEKANAALIQVHQAKGGGFSQGVNAKRFPANSILTPVGTLCMQLLGQGDSRVTKRAGAIIASDHGNVPMPNWNGGIKLVDGDSFKTVKSAEPFPLYRWYYLTQTIFQATEAEGKAWKRWNENLKYELLKNQESDGSWVMKQQLGDFRLKDKDDLAIYTTSMAALMLEVYYRYLPSYSVKEAPKNQLDVAARLDAAKLGLLSRLSEGIDPDAALLLGAGLHQIDPVQFGEFNGKPIQPSEPQLTDEFKVYSTLSSTIGVRKVDDFPQVLQPNQRVAFFLDELLPAGFQWHLVMQMTVSVDKNHSGQHFPFLEVVINGQTIHNECLEDSPNLISVLIPADQFLGFNNVLEIRNNGPVPWCFDALRLETPVLPGKSLYLAAEDWNDLPKDSQYLFNVGVVSIHLDGNVEYPTESQMNGLELLKPDDDSLWSRRSATWMLRKNIDSIAEVVPNQKSFLREQSRLVSQMLIQKTEPMIRLHTQSPPDAIRVIAAAFGAFVTHWQVEGGDCEQTVAIIKQFSPQAQIITSESQPGSGQFFSCNYYRNNLIPAKHLMKSESYAPGLTYWGGWDEKGDEADGERKQLRYLRRGGRSIVEWLSGGGSGVVLGKVKTGGVFYDSLYGTSLPALTALRQVGYLFEGSPQWLPSGFYPASSDSPALFSSSIAALNAPGMATVVVARRFPRSREFEVIAQVPWSGSTQMVFHTGYIPKGSPYSHLSTPLETKTETITIKDNLFRWRGILSTEMAVFRLIQDDTRRINQVKPPQIAWSKPVNSLQYDTTIAQRSLNNPVSTQIRTKACYFKDNSHTVGRYCKTEMVTATKPVDRKPQSLMPSEPDSGLVLFRAGASSMSDSAFIRIRSRLPKAERLSFLVYPRRNLNAKESSDNLLMRFALTSDDRIFQVPLTLEQWNRVDIPLAQIKLAYSTSLRILAPSFDKDWASVSYEINDIAMYGSEHTKFGSSGLEHAIVQPLSDHGQAQVILFGKPNSYGEYRYYPKPGWKIAKVQINDGSVPDQFKGVIPVATITTVDQKEQPKELDDAEHTKIQLNPVSGDLEAFCHFGDPLSYQNRQVILRQLVGEPLKVMKENPDLVPMIIRLEQEYHVEQ